MGCSKQRALVSGVDNLLACPPPPAACGRFLFILHMHGNYNKSRNTNNYNSNKITIIIIDINNKNSILTEWHSNTVKVLNYCCLQID